MELNEAQRQAVRDWVAGGATLADVQKRLKAEFDYVATFMEARLLVIELGARVKDKPEPRPPALPASAADEDGIDADLSSDDHAIPPTDRAPSGASSKVKVALDKIVPAGAMISGSVVFSDGTRGRWSIDRMGRLGLEGMPPNFRPSQEDVRDFQIQLQSLIAGRGY